MHFYQLLSNRLFLLLPSSNKGWLTVNHSITIFSISSEVCLSQVFMKLILQKGQK